MKKCIHGLAVATFAGLSLLGSQVAEAQVTVTTVQTSAPAVVGYVPERAGLLGLRTNYRPIVSTVPVTKTVTVQQRQLVAPPPVAVQRVPVAVQPVPVAVPVQTYRAPVPTPVPVPSAVVVPTPVAVPVTTSYFAPIPPAPVTSYYTPIYRY